MLNCKNLKYAIVLFLLIAKNAISFAQTDTGKSKASVNTSKKEVVKKDTSHQSASEKKSPAMLRVKVLEVYNQKYKDSANERHNMASIGDIVVVRVENMDSLIKLSQCKDVANGCTPQKICLFINGRLINNIYPISGAPQKKGDTNIWELQYQSNQIDSALLLVAVKKLS